MNFDFGKTVSEMAEGRTKEELLEDSNLSFRQITDDSNPYRDSGHYSRSKELRFYVEVLDAGLGDHVVMHNNGRWKVLDKYWFFSQSGKWSVVGKGTIYRSKGFPDFVERFLSNDHKYQRLMVSKS